MNIRKLRIFYETAIHLNMTKVAKSLYISQPSVSQAIGEIEDELGVKLFDRIGRKILLTHEGESYLNYTRRILNLYDEASETMKKMSNSELGKINIGASTTIGIYILPDIIRNFAEKNNNIEISLIIKNTENIEKLILENKVDFAFIEGDIHSEEINYKKVWEDEIVFITPKTEEWEKIKILSRDTLMKENFIMREEGSGTREIVQNYLTRNDINYKIYMELGSGEAIKKTVEAGLGIGCISKLCIKDEIFNDKLLVKRFEAGNIKRDLSLIYHKDKFISRNMEVFIEEILKK